MTSLSQGFAACHPMPSDDEARGTLAAAHATLSEALRCRAIEPIELHVVATWLRRAIASASPAVRGSITPDVALGLALAVRAPRHGHLCVDLRHIESAQLTPEGWTGDRISLPEDRDAWVDAISRVAPLVTSSTAEANTPWILRGSCLYTSRYHAYEAAIAARVGAWIELDATSPPATSPDLSRALDWLFRAPAPAGQAPPADVEPGANRQRLAGATALMRRFVVITGGPGMGKTWTVRNILALLLADSGLDPDTTTPLIGLAAPTGKAASRMVESLRNGLDATFEARLEASLPSGAAPAEVMSHISALEARTLHRLLGYQPQSPTRFRHHAGNPLPHDILVVDEVSMVDAPMMARLMDAVRPDARLILLGDRHQLASVEAGTVLADLCGAHRTNDMALSEQANASMQRLGVVPSGCAHAPETGIWDSIVAFNRTFRFRADSGIGQFAKACLHVPFDADAAASLLQPDPGEPSDVRLLPHSATGAPSRDALTHVATGLSPYLKLLASGRTWEEDHRFPTEAHYHRALLDAFDQFRILCAHRAGDAGVTSWNRALVHWLSRRGSVQCDDTFWIGRPVLVRANDYGIGRYNGDIGVVVETVDSGGQRRRRVAFPGPDSAESGSPDIVRYLAPSRLPDHETVFAMTIHKSQGSEFDHAMVVLPTGPSPLLTRELIYTAVTRARREMTMIGSPTTLRQGLGRTVERASGLEARLWRSAAGHP